MPDVFSNQMWLYTVDPDADEPVMLINKHIGFDEVEGWGIMGDLFQRELLALDTICQENNRKRIQVWINSPGGIVQDGLSIYSSILKSVTKCDTYCIGMAASISAVIFQAGRTRIMSDYGYLMYHNPYGSSDDQGMAAITDMIVKMITGRTEKSEDEIVKIMNRTTWIPADEALTSGFCDKVEPSAELNQKRKVATVDEAKDFWREANKIINKITFKSLDMSNELSKIANRLKLNSMASEDAVVEELTNIMNKKSDAEKKCAEMEDKLKDLENKMATAKAEAEDLKAKHDSIKKDYDSLKQKSDDDEKAKNEAKAAAEVKDKAELEVKAKNLVEQAVREGRIPATTEAINLWKTKAIADFEGVKNQIETLHINHRGVARVAELIKSTDTNDKALTTVVANSMLNLRKKYLEAK